MTVGVTGGIGSGKSLITSILREKYGYTVLDSDSIAKELERPGGLIYNRLIAQFGEEITDNAKAPAGTPPPIDKRKLSDIVFADKSREEEINAIVHPPVIEYIEAYIASHPHDDIAVETALPGTWLRKICDRIIYVYANREIRKERLRSSRAMDEDKIESIFAVQPEEEYYESLCDIRIDNNLSDTGTLFKRLRELMP